MDHLFVKKEKTLLKGIVYALFACFIWGLIFIIPQFMTGFSCLEVALGRYLFYGIISVTLLFQAFVQRRCIFPLHIWKKAFYFSLVSTIGSYTCLVLGIRYSSPAICALILGISPVTISIYGNWKEKETSFRSLIVPSLLILLGLGIFNIEKIETNASISFFTGLCFGFLALAIWSWYVVANSRFLKSTSQISSTDWCTLIGVNGLLWVMIFAAILNTFFHEQFHSEKFFTLNQELLFFLIGSTILGLFCSWLAGYFWNKACIYLPVYLTGQLTVFETLFGIAFVYLIDQALPSFSEGCGIGILIVAILFGARQLTKEELLQRQPSYQVQQSTGV